MRDLRSLPKAHLHVHLECAVRSSTLRELAAANGMPLPDGMPNGVRAYPAREGGAPYEAAVSARVAVWRSISVHPGIRRRTLNRHRRARAIVFGS